MNVPGEVNTELVGEDVIFLKTLNGNRLESQQGCTGLPHLKKGNIRTCFFGGFPGRRFFLVQPKTQIYICNLQCGCLGTALKVS